MWTDEQLLTYRPYVASDEGFIGYAYDDITGERVDAPKGKLTFGHGINIQDSPITVDESLYLLLGRMRGFSKLLFTQLDFYYRLDIVRQYVLLNMSFNLGFNGLLGFKDTLDYIKIGNWQISHDDILNSAAARRLPARYGRLAQQMLTGVI